MKAWWAARSHREQVLLGVAAIALVIVCANQVVLVPSIAAKNAAAASLVQSQSTLLRLERLRLAGALYVAPGVTASASEGQELAAKWATEFGLIRQRDDVSQQSLSFEFGAAEPTNVFKWIERVELELGFRVQSAELTSVDNRQVKARIVLSGEASP